MKTEPKKPKRPPRKSERDDLDWTPLFGAFQEAFEWALDVAAALARDYPEEVAAVERVRAFMRARIAGEMSHVKVDDVLFTVGLIMAAIERDLGPIGVGAAAMPLTFVVRFPSADDWVPSVPRRLHSFPLAA